MSSSSSPLSRISLILLLVGVVFSSTLEQRAFAQDANDGEPRLEIVKAFIGDGRRRNVDCTAQIRKIVRDKNAVTWITHEEIGVGNDGIAYVHNDLWIYYRINGTKIVTKNGGEVRLHLKHGLRENIYEGLLEHGAYYSQFTPNFTFEYTRPKRDLEEASAQDANDGEPKLEIMRALIGDGGRKNVIVTEQVRRIVQDKNAVVPITFQGIGLEKSESGYSQKDLWVYYRVNGSLVLGETGSEGRLHLKYGGNHNVYKSLMEHAAHYSQFTPDFSFALTDEIKELPDSMPSDVVSTGPLTKKVIELDAEITRMCSGDSGRMLICHLPAIDQLIFVDLVKGEIVHTMRQPDDVCFAAGREHFYIGLPAVNQLQRWNLKSFEREAIATTDRDDRPEKFVMGCASDGPLGMVSNTKLTLWDSQELVKLNYPEDQLLKFSERSDYRVSVSADGSTFCGKSNGGSGQPFEVIRVFGNQILRQKTKGYGQNNAWAMPTADGSYLLCHTGSDQVYSRSLRSLPFAEFQRDEILPTADPAYFIALRTAGPKAQGKDTQAVSICVLPGFRRVASVEDVPALGEPYKKGFVERIHQEPKLRFLPDEQLVVCIGEESKTISILPFQLEQELKSTKQPYLFINSVVPSTLKSGFNLEHQLRTLSSSKVRFELDAGPEGMKLSETGALTWQTPKTEGEFDVVITAFNEERMSTTIAYNLMVIGERETLALNAEPEKESDSGTIMVVPRDESRHRTGDVADDTSSDSSTIALPKGDETTLQLPAKFKSVHYGGGGRFLIFHIPDRKALLVLDVISRKALKEIPVPDDAIFAAGQTKLLIALPTDALIERWDLETLEKEKTASLPLDNLPKKAMMGPSSEGPLALWGNDKVQLWDIESLTPTLERGERIRADARTHLRLSVSADGQTICGWWVGLSRQRFNAMRVHERATSVVLSPDMHELGNRWILPVADGSRLLGYGGRSYARDFEPQTIDSESEGIFVPTFDPRFVFKIQKQDRNFSQVSICLTNDLSSLVTLRDIEKVSPESALMFEGDICEQRILYLPEGNLFAYVPVTSDRVIIRDLDLEAELKKAGDNDLFVVSNPTPTATVGADYRYQIETIGNSLAPIDYSLVSGPDGMTVDRKGLVSWTADSRPPGGRVQVEVKVTAGDADVGHEFEVTVERNLDQQYEEAIPKSSLTKHGFIQLDDFRMELPNPSREIVPGLDGRLLLVCGRRLAVLSADGWKMEYTANFEKPYLSIRERENYYVGVTESPPAIDIIEKKTLKVEKTLALPGRVNSLAIHPSLPLSYVAIEQQGELPRYKFVIYNEKTGEGRENDEWIGNWVQISSRGNFLITGFTERYRRGSELLLNPARWQIVTKYGTLNWLIRYKLDRRGLPEFDEFKEDVGGGGLGVRLSADDDRVTYLSNTGYPSGSQNLSAWDASDLSKIPVTYEIKDHGTTTDIAFHPSLPLIATAANGGVVIANRGTGRAESGILPSNLSEIDDIQIMKSAFSPDGKSLLLEGRINGIDYLHKYTLNFDRVQKEKLARANPSGSESAASEAPADVEELRLVNLDAFRGQTLEGMTNASIAESFSESVVVVQSDDASGSGFVVGRAGYILTCAHCIDDEDDILVTYSDASKAPKQANADLVLIDDEKDLALIRVREKVELKAVRLSVGSELGRGDAVSVIGNPVVGDRVLDYTMTAGIISSPMRELDGSQYIQVTAEVNPGSSGGPVFNDHGMVIGMVDLKANIDGAGFAIPAAVIGRFLMEGCVDDKISLAIERDWYDSNGDGPVQATYQGLSRGRLRLKKTSDGRSFAFPLESMSLLDQAFVNLLNESLAKSKE